MASDDTSTFLQLQASYDAGSSSRATLQTFMVNNHDRLSAMFGNRRINWIALTAAFTKIGFRTHNGDELKKDVVRVTWSRAKKLHAAQSSRRP